MGGAKGRGEETKLGGGGGGGRDEETPDKIHCRHPAQGRQARDGRAFFSFSMVVVVVVKAESDSETNQ